MRLFKFILESIITLALAAGLVWAVRERIELADRKPIGKSDVAVGHGSRIRYDAESPVNRQMPPRIATGAQSQGNRNGPVNTIPRNGPPPFVTVDSGARPATAAPASPTLVSPTLSTPSPPPAPVSASPIPTHPPVRDIYAAASPLKLFFAADPVALVVATSAAKPPATIRIGLVGDIDIPQQIKDKLLKNKSYDMLAGVAKVRAGLDILAGNLESQLTVSTSATASKPEETIKDKTEFLLKDEPKYAKILRRAGFRVFCVANNHAMDWGWAGLRESLAALNNAGISPIGAGKDDKAARKPRFIDVKGKIIGFLAYTATIPDGYAAGPGKPGVAAGRGAGTANLGFTYSKKLAEEVKAARAKCDFLIVGFHWGVEKSPDPDKLQREIAQVLVNAGADVVWGHGPHVLQPVELIAGKPVAFSMGDFIWHNNKDTALFELVLVEGKDGKLSLSKATMHGCKIKDGAPSLTGEDTPIIPAPVQK